MSEQGESAAPAEPEEATVPAEQVRAIIEALVFASPEPVTPRQIDSILGEAIPRDSLRDALKRLQEAYAQDDRGLQLIEVAGGYQITTRPELNDWVRELVDPKTPTRLSIQALETLAVIAYKQPTTLPEVIELRGVKSGSVIKTLLEKRLIRIVGRKEVVGRPILYGTSKQFLLQFGLKSLKELPEIEEFAQVLGDEVDVAGLKRAIEAPRQTGSEVEEVDPHDAAADSGDAPTPDAASAPTPDAAEAPGTQAPPEPDTDPSDLK